MADPWDSAFAAYNQALVDLNGDGLPDAVMRMPQGITATVPPQAATGQDRRQIQRRAMAGLEPTEQQNALLRNAMPQLEENSARLGNFGMELTGIPQVGRAGQAIGEAFSDPSLGNVTNASVQSAVAAFRPMAALKMLGAGFGASVADDMGAFVSTANASGSKLPGLTPDQQKQYDAAMLKVQKGKFGSAADRRQTEQTLSELRSLSNDSIRDRNKSGSDEYNRAVKTAEDARDAILSNKPRKFSETTTGQLYDKVGVLVPGLAGMGGAAIGRAFSGGGTVLKDYIAPMITGAATGGVAANWPLAHEIIFQPPGNNEQKAYEAYARELPPDHPRKQEFLEYARGLPLENPDRAAASRELYDPIRLAERTGLGAAEGLLGGLAGAHTVAIAEKAASAAKNALTKKRGGAEPPEPPPEPPPQVYRAYPELPADVRVPVQEAYLAYRGLHGVGLPPKEGAVAIKNSLAGRGVTVPVTAQRVNATNGIYDDFIRLNGRPPTRSEANALFSRYTLAIPAGVVGGAAAYEPVNRLMQYYQGITPEG